eukprot:GHVR01081603.1.p1 GENE.GHVR01081603.1~~GHVR01081603.1.p1  ORF type:complete len:301 (+),score=10.36 GHVR01081603.1:71-904(+)
MVFGKLILFYPNQINHILLNNLKDNKIICRQMLHSLYKIFYYIDKNDAIKLCFRKPVGITDEIFYYNFLHLLKIYSDLIDSIYVVKGTLSSLRPYYLDLLRKETLYDTLMFLFSFNYSQNRRVIFNEVNIGPYRFYEKSDVYHLDKKSIQQFMYYVIENFNDVTGGTKDSICKSKNDPIYTGKNNVSEQILNNITNPKLLEAIANNNTLSAISINTVIVAAADSIKIPSVKILNNNVLSKDTNPLFYEDYDLYYGHVKANACLWIYPSIFYQMLIVT